MNLTAEQKKMVALAVLLPIAAYMGYTTFLSGGPGDGGSAASSSGPPAAASTPQRLRTLDLARESAEASGGASRQGAPQISRASMGPPGGGRNRLNTAQEFVPRVGGRRPEDRADPAKTDPTLRLELLARLQQLPPSAAGGRSLFAFSDAPPVATTKDTTIKLDKSKKDGGKKDGTDIAKAEPPPPPPVSRPAEEPPPPAIPLKFYGFVHGQGGKRAFFRLGEEEIFMASEGQMVQGRYKIVRIGLSSAMVEDTQHKNNQQSLRIEEIPKENL